jgi:hypothetical protein
VTDTRPSAAEPAEPLVIGREMAAARAADQRHRQTDPDAVSPLAGIRYERDSGAHDLHRFVASDADARVAAALATFTTAGAEAQAAARSALDTNDLYTLLTFVQRAALAALTGHESPSLPEAAAALVAVDRDRVDWRDHARAVTLLAWSIHASGADHRAVLLDAASASGAPIDGLIQRLADRPGTELDPGPPVITTPDGLAFAESYYSRYRPKHDLVRAAFAVQSVLERDVYRVDGLTVAATLPPIWLTPGDDGAVGTALGRIRAAVNVTASVIDPACETPEAQSLTVFLVEAETDDDARAIAAAAIPSERAEVLGVVTGPVVSVVVGRSFHQGVDSYETPGALDRFAEPLRLALADQIRPLPPKTASENR